MRPVLLLLVALLAFAAADIYLHNPRGSNNRLHGDGTNAGNQNRLFDSQNNAKGGYNQGYMFYYTGSILPIEWTNQHGAGLNPLVNSQIIIQYMCDDTNPDLRDGSDERTIDPKDPNDFRRGQHEPFQHYAECVARERNKGLFLADQKLNGDRAIFTRQTNNGERFGFECTEERDYYPYWHPTPWRDAAILTSDLSRCDYYRKNSQNVLNKGHCTLSKAQWAAWNKALSEPVSPTKAPTNGSSSVVPPSEAWQYNNAAACTSHAFVWAVDGAWKLPPPYCGMPPTSRDNHLGNAYNYAAHSSRGFQGFPAMWNWTLPSLGGQTRKCVLRVRYNVSTGDYDGWNINNSSNGDASPVRDNPTVTLHNGSFPVALKLNINTDQFGRTFEDRSHVFELVPNPGVCSGGKLYNLNVRGKRGNIVQVYPAVEYDFVPERLLLRENDCAHVQWTGSNTNPQGNDGEGVAGSDRSNMVQLAHSLDNLPIRGLGNITMVRRSGAMGVSQLEALLRLGTMRDDYQNEQPQLNDAAPYFNAGVVRFRKGTYHYMSTRNNNFSNRSQKGTLVVGKGSGFSWNWAIIVGCIIFGVCVLVGATVAWAVWGEAHPDSMLGVSWLGTRDFVTGFVNH